MRGSATHIRQCVWCRCCALAALAGRSIDRGAWHCLWMDSAEEIQAKRTLVARRRRQLAHFLPTETNKQRAPSCCRPDQSSYPSLDQAMQPFECLAEEAGRAAWLLDAASQVF